jgi:hypothetical protein
MSLLAITKKFLNSTTGSAGSKPLDQLIGVKSVQRGVTTEGLTVTISSVNVGKSFVISVSKGSGGYVAARGALALQSKVYSSGTALGDTPPGSVVSSSTGQITGGSTDLTVREYSARLTGASSLVCDGPVEWQVVEYL